MNSTISRRRRLLAVSLWLACPAYAAAQATTDPSRSISLDSLLNTRISAASKYAQTSSEAPASVTILTSDDIERFGYGHLEELIESVRGFYMTNDRNYSYLGTRGFGRPSDYNNRILLLVDGHSLNDQTWGGAPMGRDLPINLAAIERIEVVRGPGAALYGTSAMFAVINIVTKSGAALDGIIAGARLGSDVERQATLVGGRLFGSRVSVAASGLVSRSDGEDLYFKEYDSTQTNNGIARNLDWQRSVSGLGALTVGEATVRIGYISHQKGIPTGAYGSVFNDPRNERSDRTLWADVSMAHEYKGRFRVSTRLYADRYQYRGVYPGDAGPAYEDGGGSTDAGAEVLGIWEATSRNRLTLGTEYRHVSRANYFELFPDGTESSDDEPFDIASVFTQEEFQLTSHVTLVGGLRVEHNSRHGTAGAPRLALVATPDAATTIKLLYGEAFRSPSAAEADITTSFYRRNLTLRPERIRTLELALARRLGAGVLASSSLYTYRIRDLIDQVQITADGVLEYRNTAASEGSGAEVELDVRPVDAYQMRASYALQRSEAEPGDLILTNSPQQIATASVTLQDRLGFHSTIGTRYESGRRTINGPSTPAFFRTDVHVAYSGRQFAGADLGVRVTNLFNIYYATPAGLEHRQSSLAQDGRRTSLMLSWRF